MAIKGLWYGGRRQTFNFMDIKNNAFVIGCGIYDWKKKQKIGWDI